MSYFAGSSAADTIVAIATPPGRAGLGLVRISGNQAQTLAAALLRQPSAAALSSKPLDRKPLERKPLELKPRQATLAFLVDEHEAIVDEVVATLFAAPKSYTGEDVLELALHGAPVLLRFAVERACQLGARLAEPGEFTLRAFLRGRLTLPQAEAVRDLIGATTLYQARVAARQVGGSLSRTLQPIKDQLVELIAVLEAGIDFAEDDVSVEADAGILARLAPVQAEVTRLAATYKSGRYVQEGIALAIVGRPNVGKSSLFNQLVQADRAIVTDIPGTTRDLVSETVSLGGVPARLVDTAGIRQGQDLVESLGIARSLQAMADADLTLVVVDCSVGMLPEDEEILAKAAEQGRYLLVANKVDLAAASTAASTAAIPADAIAVSAQSGAGVDQLRHQILEKIGLAAEAGEEFAGLTNLRHAQRLSECADALEAARLAVQARIPHEMLLLDLYRALQALDAVTGATTADDILNRIFTTFCIGK